jgi:hypothetical protein
MVIHISELNLYEWKLTTEQIKFMEDNNYTIQEMVDRSFYPDPSLCITEQYFKAEDSTDD